MAMRSNAPTKQPVCPKCGGLMEPAEEKGLPLDRCTSCRGIWIDFFSLDAVLRKQTSVKYVGDAEDLMNPGASRPTALTCPRCDARLFECSHAGITLEWCAGCRGLYLDDGEIGQIRAWRRRNCGKRLGNAAGHLASLSVGAAADQMASWWLPDLYNWALSAFTEAKDLRQAKREHDESRLPRPFGSDTKRS